MDSQIIFHVLLTEQNSYITCMHYESESSSKFKSKTNMQSQNILHALQVLFPTKQNSQ
jgi:hypothetical protein